MPRGLDVSLPEELQPAVLEPAMIVDWLAKEQGKDMEEEISEEEKKYMVNKAGTLRYISVCVCKLSRLLYHHFYADWNL